ncbi:MAG: hypothetical protein ACE368_07210 [Paracoccaceae bacterium]
MRTAFSSDCIGRSKRSTKRWRNLEEAGGESFTYIPCLNDDAAHVAALGEVIEATCAAAGLIPPVASRNLGQN